MTILWVIIYCSLFLLLPKFTGIKCVIIDVWACPLHYFSIWLSYSSLYLRVVWKILPCLKCFLFRFGGIFYTIGYNLPWSHVFFLIFLCVRECWFVYIFTNMNQFDLFIQFKDKNNQRESEDISHWRGKLIASLFQNRKLFAKYCLGKCMCCIFLSTHSRFACVWHGFCSQKTLIRNFDLVTWGVVFSGWKSHQASKESLARSLKSQGCVC